MAKRRPVLPEGYDLESFLIAKLLAKGANVLFIYNTDYERIQRYVRDLGIHATIMNDDLTELEKARNYGFDVISGNINSDIWAEMQPKQFDYLVIDEFFNSARYPYDTLLRFNYVAKYIVICHKNQAYWRKRLRFLFSGSHFVKNQWEIVNDGPEAWFNREPWLFSHKDIVNLCSCAELKIKKGIIMYKNGIIDNMYDIRSYPNLYAYKMFYLISNEDNITTPLFKLGGLEAL